MSKRNITCVLVAAVTLEPLHPVPAKVPYRCHGADALLAAVYEEIVRDISTWRFRISKD